MQMWIHKCIWSNMETVQHPQCRWDDSGSSHLHWGVVEIRASVRDTCSSFCLSWVWSRSCFPLPCTLVVFTWFMLTSVQVDWAVSPFGKRKIIKHRTEIWPVRGYTHIFIGRWQVDKIILLVLQLDATSVSQVSQTARSQPLPQLIENSVQKLMSLEGWDSED